MTQAPQRLTLACLLGGSTCAVAWASTPSELAWLKLGWAGGLATAFLLGAANAWRRRHFTLYVRFGGRTEYAGLAARLWAVVLGLCGSAVALGATLHGFVGSPTERQLGLAWCLSTSPICLGFMLVASSANRELGVHKRRARLAVVLLSFAVFSPLVLLTGFFAVLGAYAFITGTRLHW